MFRGATLPLGTIAKSSPTFQKLRADRFALLKKIRAIYLSAGVAAGLDIPTKFHRTSLCKHACTGSAGVELNLLKEANRAFYKGLKRAEVCGPAPSVRTRSRRSAGKKLLTRWHIFTARKSRL